ncbi:Ribonuclease H-like superfamily, partial [Arabidopsis suecica]
MDVTLWLAITDELEPWGLRAVDQADLLSRVWAAQQKDEDLFHWPENHKTEFETSNNMTILVNRPNIKFWSSCSKSLPMPESKWDMITMNFVIDLLMCDKKDIVWVIVDRLTKWAHFVQVNKSANIDKLVEIYVQEIVRYHGLMGGEWIQHLHLAKFAYNNSYHASIRILPYEALYGLPCRTPLCWTQVGEQSVYGRDLVEKTSKNIKILKVKMKQAQNRQKRCIVALEKRQRELEFSVGDMVYLKTMTYKGKDRASLNTKLTP